GEEGEVFEDRRLDRLAIAAIRDVKGKDTRRSAGAQVLKDGSLNLRLVVTPHAARRIHRGRLRKKSGMSGTPAPLLVGRQSDEVASPVRGGRLSGGPIGCGVSLSRLMRAASLGSTAANGMAIRAKLSAPPLASSSCPHP